PRTLRRRTRPARAPLRCARHPPRGPRARRACRCHAASRVLPLRAAGRKRAMSLVLLVPAGLLALGALLLPILIHLVRRLELQLTDFAALRWLSDRVRPQRRVRIERPWLLLVRLFLLGLLALLLARPALVGTTDAARDWVLVTPGVSPAAARAAVSAPDADWRWLAADFPPLGAPSPEPPVPLASLLREADARLPAARSLHVVVPAELDGLDGARPALGRAVDWQVVAGRMPGVDADADA